jgi:hypothetical protein
MVIFACIMTTAEYYILKKALLKKKAEVRASPAAAKRLLTESGLWDVLEDAPVSVSPAKKVAAKKAAAKL